MSVPPEHLAQPLRRLPEPRRFERERRPTKQELYARAKALDIPRRSAMTKDELARAIARRER
jgi:hypothetical protein